MKADLQSTGVFAAVDRCIYCGDVENLRDEHIIPFGLGGKMVLPKSSCKRCADITSAVEGIVQQRMLGPFRARAGFPTRHKKRRPTAYTVERHDSGGGRETIDLPVADYPSHCAGFELPLAGYLSDGTPDAPIDAGVVVRGNIWDLERVPRKLGERIAVPIVVNAPAFMRMLAKIAHAYASAAYGLGKVEALLPDLILGKSAQAAWLVGGSGARPQRPAGADDLHVLALSEWRDENDDARRVLVAEIQLFSSLGMPCYNVVVGKLTRA